MKKNLSLSGDSLIYLIDNEGPVVITSESLKETFQSRKPTFVTGTREIIAEFIDANCGARTGHNVIDFMAIRTLEEFNRDNGYAEAKILGRKISNFSSLSKGNDHCVSILDEEGCIWIIYFNKKL